MRLRCLGRFAAFAPDPRQFEDPEPHEDDGPDHCDDEGRQVFARHQRFSISMYTPKHQTAIAMPVFVIAHGYVSVPETRRSSSENVTQRMANSRAASAMRSVRWSFLAVVNFILTEATSACTRVVKSATPCGT